MKSIKSLFSGKKQDNDKSRVNQNPTSWDVVVLSFREFWAQMGFWIQPNVWMVLISLPILTIPAAKAGLYQTVRAGLKDIAQIRVKSREEMKKGFFSFGKKATLLEFIRWLALVIIVVSTLFWVSQETWLLRSVSLIGFYALTIWWLASTYLYALLVEKPELGAIDLIKKTLDLVFKRPFDTLLFATVSGLLNILGIILLGPVLLIIPAMRAIIHLHGYWFVSGETIPGFEDPIEYSEKYYK